MALVVIGRNLIKFAFLWVTRQPKKPKTLPTVGRRAADALDEDLEYVKDENPFLNGLEAVIEGIVAAKLNAGLQ